MASGFDYIERLGAGNFGEVWLVTDVSLNTERALKLIPPEKVLNPTNFFHEAQILKAVEHPNIVKVEEAGTMDDGRLYVAMEYCPKRSVEEEAKGSYLPLTRAKRLIIDVLRGLEHAHIKNVLHRDIKPANILVGNEGQGKLSDFGLAIPKDLDLKSLGIKDYIYTLHLAPEVKGANDYSVQSDIYSCSITLYRLVNGDSILPSLPMSQLRSLAQIGKFPNRNSYRAFVPRSLITIINRAISVDPHKRYNSAADMRHAIERIAIDKNWTERTLQNGQQWKCGWNNKCYEVSKLRRSDGLWDVTVKRGPNRKNYVELLIYV